VSAATSRRIDPWLLVALTCAIGFVLLGVVVNGRGWFAFDEPVAALVQSLPIPTEAWLAITQAGGWILLPVGAGLVLGLLALRQYRLAVVVAVALLGATFLTDHVKDLISRPRPPDPLVTVDGYSFPSGHSLMSATTYGLVALVAWRSELPVGARRVIVAALVVVGLLVGLSRSGLGVHYPSDVLAGWLAGVAIVATVAAIAGRVSVGSVGSTRAVGSMGATTAVGSASDPDPLTVD
jgi:undecaprenyl-diphosphatase